MPDIFVKIIRDLAKSDPICWYGYESEAHCFVCASDYEVKEPNEHGGSNLVGFIHEHDCLWIRARKALNLEIAPHKILDDPIETTAREKPDFSGYLTVEKVPGGDGRNYLDEILQNLEYGGYLIGFLTNSQFVRMELKDGYRVVFHFLAIT